MFPFSGSDELNRPRGPLFRDLSPRMTNPKTGRPMRNMPWAPPPKDPTPLRPTSLDFSPGRRSPVASEKKVSTKSKSSAAANLLRLGRGDPSPSAQGAEPQSNRLDSLEAQMKVMLNSLRDIQQYMRPHPDRAAPAPDLPAPRDTDEDAMAAQLEAFSSEEASVLPRKLKRLMQLDKDSAADQGVTPELLQALKGLMDASSSKVSPPHPPPQTSAFHAANTRGELERVKRETEDKSLRDASVKDRTKACDNLGSFVEFFKKRRLLAEGPQQEEYQFVFNQAVHIAHHPGFGWPRAKSWFLSRYDEFDNDPYLSVGTAFGMDYYIKAGSTGNFIKGLPPNFMVETMPAVTKSTYEKDKDAKKQREWGEGISFSSQKTADFSVECTKHKKWYKPSANHSSDNCRKKP